MQETQLGRPPLKLNWNTIDALLQAGCSGIRIAGRLGIAKQTLYEHSVIDKGMSFSDYSHQHYAAGEAEIQQAQYLKAVEDRDSTMLVLLGKLRLGQNDKETDADKARKEAKECLSELTQDSGYVSGISLAEGSEGTNEPPLLHQGQPGQESEVQPELGTAGISDGSSPT